MNKANLVPLNPSELDELDGAILDYLQEGRESDGPWGRATPALVCEELTERGWSEDELPVRQTINNRMGDLALAGHLRNLRDRGVYEFVSDPRSDVDDE